MYIGVQDSSHLSLLNRANLALGVHDEHTNILLTTETVDGSRAGVTTGCANNGQVFSGLSLLFTTVSAGEEVLKQVSKELKSDIFESKGRAVEEFQQVEVLLLVEGGDGNDVVCAESAIALLDDLLEVGFGDFLAGNIEGEDLKGEVLERQIPPSCLPVGWEGGDLFGDEQAAVVGETL